MPIGKGINSISLQDILSNTTEANILSYYLGITKVPCLIHSPFRRDRNPSFGFFSPDGVKIYYNDFATNDRGNIYKLLSNLWGCSYTEVLLRIKRELLTSKDIQVKKYIPAIRVNSVHNNSSLQVKIRNWESYDIEYWESFGITLKWLKFANVYPISHKIIIKDGKKYVFKSDKYAYAYVEYKEGKVSIKIYQPLNKKGYKWLSKHDSSVISLWAQLPKKADKVCICASVKDALCLMSNIKIPSIALQGEGYKISNTAIKELKKRFKQIYICLDNDLPGLKDADKLAEETGFINTVLPYFEEGKDIADFYKAKGKETFIKELSPLFN